MAKPAVVDNALEQIRQQKAREMMNEIRDRYGEGTLAAIISGDPNYRASVTRDSYPTAGPYYSPAGVREAYEGYGIPPVLYQRSPFASAGFRSFVDPFGQMMVQPLVGFPSAYPHVLSGVPTNPMNVFQMAMQGMPFMPWMMGGWGGMPMMPQGGQAAPRGGNGSGAPSTTKKAATTTPPATPAAPPMAVSHQIDNRGLQLSGDSPFLDENLRTVVAPPAPAMAVSHGATPNIDVPSLARAQEVMPNAMASTPVNPAWDAEIDWINDYPSETVDWSSLPQLNRTVDVPVLAQIEVPSTVQDALGVTRYATDGSPVIFPNIDVDAVRRDAVQPPTSAYSGGNDVKGYFQDLLGNIFGVRNYGTGLR